MGIFEKKNKDERQAKNGELIKSLSANHDVYLKAIGERLAYLKTHPETLVMKPFNLYCDVVEMMMANPKYYQPASYGDIIRYGEEIYKDVFVYEEDTAGFDDLVPIFLEMFDAEGVVYKRCFEPAFYHIFTDKFNYIKWMKSLGSHKNLVKAREYYVPYALASRAYFADEEVFTANIAAVTLRMIKSPDPKSVYEEEMSKIEHMAGIYNVDEARLLKAEQRLESAEAVLSRAGEVMKVSNERIETLEAMTAKAVQQVKTVCDTDVEAAKSELSMLREKIQQALDEFVAGQQKTILYDKQQLLAEVFEDAEKKLREMQTAARNAVSAANTELMRLNRESGNVITKLDNYLQDEERVKTLLADAGEREELFAKLDRLSTLSSTAIGALESGAAIPAEIPAAKASRGKGAVTEQAAAASGQVVRVQAEASVEEVIEVVDDETIRPVNPLLDESVPFKKRFDIAMERKKKLAAQGVIFHEKFDDVLTLVMENANPYLIGPTGCGKTFMVAQIAKILEASFIDIGYINEEYDILGFQTANGGYSKPNFYRCYKYGRIAFCDELDNGSSRATVKLNSFLTNSADASYSFPGGETVRRHPNFRIIGAGNTAGNGADNNYNTREKIEESVQQRFTPVYVGYDNRVEKQILTQYKDWFEFLVLFRRATDAWGKSNFSEAAGIITTRDAVRVKKYLDNGSLTPEKILTYEFIQTKEIGYLAFLASFMTKEVKPKAPGAELVKLFDDQVTALRKAAAEQ